MNLAEILKALADDTRLRIMVLLYQKELCVCELCDVMETSQPKISRHLAILRNAGLVQDKRQSQWVFYNINPDQRIIEDLIEALLSHMETYPDLTKDKARLDQKIRDNSLCTLKQEACCEQI